MESCSPGVLLQGEGRVGGAVLVAMPVSPLGSPGVSRSAVGAAVQGSCLGNCQCCEQPLEYAIHEERRKRYAVVARRRARHVRDAIMLCGGAFAWQRASGESGRS